MLTKDFIKEVEKLGFEVGQGINIILIYDENYELAYIYRNKKFHVGTNSEFSEYLPEELQKKLYNLIDDYARTPLDEREEPEKFYLKFKLRTNYSDDFLNLNTTFDWFEISTKSNSDKFQTEFTQKEIDEIKEKFGVTLSDFEQIPIEESEEF